MRVPFPAVGCSVALKRKSRSRETALPETDVMTLRLPLPHERFFSSLVFATVAHSAPSLGSASSIGLSQVGDIHRRQGRPRHGRVVSSRFLARRALLTGTCACGRGSIRRHPHLSIARFHQHSTEQLDPTRTVLDYFIDNYPGAKTTDEWRSYVGRYGFSGTTGASPCPCHALLGLHRTACRETRGNRS